jgi:predicted lactoylglutathione lyase
MAVCTSQRLLLENENPFVLSFGSQTSCKALEQALGGMRSAVGRTPEFAQGANFPAGGGKETIMEMMTTKAMTAEQAAEWGKTLDFPTVWATIQESSKRTEKRFQENAAQMKAMSQETDKGSQKTDWDIEELPESFDEVDALRWDLVERLRPAHLFEKFAALGFDFNQSFQDGSVMDNETQHGVIVEMMLLNNAIGMVVESRPMITQDDIDEHEKRMEMLSHGTKSPFAHLKLYGARAFVKGSKIARQYAIDKGFFVIQLTDNTITVDMPEGWTPKTW